MHFDYVLLTGLLRDFLDAFLSEWLNFFLTSWYSCRDRSVDIAIGNELDGPRFDSQQGKEFSLSSTAFRLALGPTILLYNGHPRVLSSEVKRPRREADHSYLSSVEVKNGGAIPPLPHVFMAQCLINHGDNFMYHGIGNEAYSSFKNVFQLFQTLIRRLVINTRVHVVSDNCKCCE
jgi:hypothetical protein